MPRSSFLAATLIALGLLVTGQAEARSPATPSQAVSTQARASHPGRSANRQPARPSTSRTEAARESRPCRSGASVSMFYSTQPGPTVTRTGWSAGPVAPSHTVLGPACSPRANGTWT